MGMDVEVGSGALAGAVTATSDGVFTFHDPSTLNFGAVTGGTIGAAADKLGFYGHAPVVRPGGTPAAAIDLATVIALANSLRTSLLALGLIA